MELRHAFYSNMTQTAMPQINGIIIIRFKSFGINVMDVSITIAIKIK